MNRQATTQKLEEWVPAVFVFVAGIALWQGAIIAFELKGGVDAGRNFIDSLELFSHLANVGDVRKALVDAKAQGKHQVLMRVKQGDTTHFVALPLGDA